MEIADGIPMDKKRKHTIEIVVDRLVLKPDVKGRLTDSIETALKLAEGLATINVLGEKGGRDLVFSDQLACIRCGISVPELAPRMFSFNRRTAPAPRATASARTSRSIPRRSSRTRPCRCTRGRSKGHGASASRCCGWRWRHWERRCASTPARRS
jgi:hypothetical protein